MAIEGNTLVTVAPTHDETDTQSGVGYIIDAATGQELHRLIPAGSYRNQFFGDAVDIHNGVIAISAANDSPAGAVYLFDAATGEQLRVIVPPDPANQLRFGVGLSLTDDYLLVCASGDNAFTGSVYVYDLETGDFLRKIRTEDGERIFSYIDAEGDTAIVGAPADATKGFSAGALYVFDIPTGTQLRKITCDESVAGDLFGISVALEGTTAIVGAYGRDDQGAESGAAYLYDITNGALLAKLLPTDGRADHRFGYDVALAGDTALVGASIDQPAGFLNGVAYTFNTRTAAQLERYDAINPRLTTGFGHAVALSPGYVVVGSRFHDHPLLGANIGAVYLFDPPAGAHPADFNADGAVDAADLATLLAHWGTPGADLDANGFTDAADLAILLAAWGG